MTAQRGPDAAPQRRTRLTRSRPSGSVRRRCADDRGAVAVLVLALAAVVALAGATASAVAAVGVARQRAAAVADLAALAAAQRAHEGSASACARAARLAERNGGTLRSCLLAGDIAQVLAEVRPPGRLGRLGSATAGARAGPAALQPEGTP